MTFRFPFISAKRTFSQINEPGYASDFTLFKKKSVQCVPKPCYTAVDPTYLYVNLIKKLDLTNVDVVQSLTSPIVPTTIDTSKPFYLSYTIDPTGVLFGNTPCGMNNYPNFMVYE